MKSCLRCGRDNQDQHGFCVGCGHDLPPAPPPGVGPPSRRCPRCNYETSILSARCDGCGGDLDAVAAAPAPADLGVRCKTCGHHNSAVTFCVNCGERLPARSPVVVVTPPQPTSPPPVIGPPGNPPPPDFLRAPVRPLPPLNPPPPMVELRECARCGRRQQPHYKFCLSCGADMPPLGPPPGLRGCHRCGKPDPASKFCLGCGALLPPQARPWRAKLSTDPVEHDLLAALRITPSDVGARMVYADWLEQRGDPRAELVRHEGTPPTPRGDREWRTIASRVAITGCDRGSQCPGRWDLLAADPDDECVRRCGECARVVTYCEAPFGSRDPIVIDDGD